MSDSTERYQLPEQLRMAAGAVRDYVRNEIVPLEQQIPHDSIHLPKDEYDRLVPVAKDMGMWCTGVPTEFGGGGLSLFSQVVIDEEMVQHAAGLYCPVYGTMGEPPPEIIFAGNDYLRDTYGIPTVQGQRKAWFAITEPSGGSDPARAIQTRAVRDGDDWVINGSKVFISGALWGDWGIVFARTNPETRRGVTAFVVENSWPGFDLTPIPVIRAYTPAQLFFQDLRVPARNVLGEVDGGWDILANQLLARGRIPYSAANLGVSVAAHRMAVDTRRPARPSALPSPPDRRSSGCSSTPRSKSAPAAGSRGKPPGNTTPERTSGRRRQSPSSTPQRSLPGSSTAPSRSTAVMV